MLAYAYGLSIGQIAQSSRDCFSPMFLIFIGEVCHCNFVFRVDVIVLVDRMIFLI